MGDIQPLNAVRVNRFENFMNILEELNPFSSSFGMFSHLKLD
jgi:hypothetical protein